MFASLQSLIDDRAGDGLMKDGQANAWLVAGAGLSFLAAAMHIAVIIGGADWYRTFGAGEALATMAEQGSLVPDVLTVFIAAVLFVWGLFALSGAGVIRQLPMLKPGLTVISAIYLIRGIAPFVAMPFMPVFVSSFWILSSLVCTLYGVAYGVGTYKILRTQQIAP